MSDFWSWYIIILVVINIAGCWALLHFTRKMDTETAEDGTTGHEYDGIREYNKPLPRWWLWMFYISIIYSVIYLALYPGLGKYAGYFGWTSAGQHQEQVEAAKEKFGPIFAKYAGIKIKELVKEEKAITMGQRIFANNCSACHGSDARGVPGYPDLTDSDWLYGSSPSEIKRTITSGRTGMMPPHGAVLGEEGLKNVVAYVLSLSGGKASMGDVEAGRDKYMLCAACHGPEGKGNSMMGAPNLTDSVWLYGGSEGQIAKTIKEGRMGVMPAHRDILSPEQIHLVSAYIYSLSNN